MMWLISQNSCVWTVIGLVRIHRLHLFAQKTHSDQTLLLKMLNIYFVSKMQKVGMKVYNTNKHFRGPNV